MSRKTSVLYKGMTLGWPYETNRESWAKERV